MRSRWSLGLAACAALLTAATAARGDGIPHGAAIVRVLGPDAERVLAPQTGVIGALVRIPPGTSAASLGVEEVVPGIGHLRGKAPKLLAFAAAHPDVPLEVSPPLHMLLDKAGQYVNVNVAHDTLGVDGTGTLVGIADVGLDVTHPDFLDADGKSRVAWLLDLSMKPAGLHPDLEQKFGIKNDAGVVTNGAVFTGDEIDMLRAQMSKNLPQDEIGHGTHVAGIAAGNGGLNPHTPFVGMAPGAKLVIARVAGANGGESIEDDAALAGVAFIFDRADAMKLPIAVNFSLGKDFGPHDGSTSWEQALASFVGPDKPGHAFVVAAGNSGDVVESQVHQSVYVPDGTRVHVPVATTGARAGGVQIWITFRDGADVSVGLEAPNGEWISPVSPGAEKGYNQNLVNAGVINGDSVADSPIPKGSHGAVVIWNGQWPSGRYDVTLEGHGTAELYLQAIGDAALSFGGVGFASGVRSGTVDLPATHPGIIAVGCTVSKPKWTSMNGGDVVFVVPNLDPAGMLPDSGHTLRRLTDGEPCYFSGAGPNASGVQKPEISAPGAVIASSMSKQAIPGTPGSIFTNPECPGVHKGDPPDPRCMQVDATHAVNAGTSMSAPMVTGAVALLFQRDPTLTQDKIAALLQAGAHPLRATEPYPDDAQGGPGELDVAGALAALEESRGGVMRLPSRATSWMTLSEDYVPADGSTPLEGIVELRTDDGQHRGDGFDASRLQGWARIGDGSVPVQSLTRRAPGLWTITVPVAAGRGGEAITVGVTFDGQDVVAPRTVPIAADLWTASYAPTVKGGCAVAWSKSTNAGWAAALVGIGLLAHRRRSASRR